MGKGGGSEGVSKGKGRRKMERNHEFFIRHLHYVCNNPKLHKETKLQYLDSIESEMKKMREKIEGNCGAKKPIHSEFQTT